LKSLKALMQKLDGSRSVYATGDLIDRGPASKGVVQFIMDNGIKTVMGNHEHLMLASLGLIKAPGYGNKEHARRSWMKNGGLDTIASYNKGIRAEDASFDQNHLDFLKSLPYVLSVPDQLGDGRTIQITHAAVYGKTIKDDLEWLKSPLKFSQFPLNYTFLYNRDSPYVNPDLLQVFGHTVLSEPMVEEGWAVIDGGCAYGRELWALDVKNMAVIRQVMID